MTACCRLLAPVGCPECSGVAFCSVSCKDQAISSYHCYECHYMDLLVGSGMSILCHLALRMVTQSGLQHFLDIKDTLHESFSQPNMNPGDLCFLKTKICPSNNMSTILFFWGSIVKSINEKYILLNRSKKNATDKICWSLYPQILNILF